MKRTAPTILLFLVALIGMSLLMAPVALAQEDDGATDAPKKTSALQLIKYGGIPGYFIILMSIVGVGLVIEHFITIRRDNLVPPELLGHVERLFEDEEYEEVMTICETQPCFFTNVLAAGLPKIGTGYENIEKAMAEVGEMEATKLQQKISYINLIANIAPLCGLLGTVIGMVGAFNTIATSNTTPDPSKLADGIQQALVTTVMGLTLCIPMTVFYFFFRNRVVRVIMEIGAITEELMEKFRDEPQ